MDNSVNPNSLTLIIQSAKNGRISPYNIKLAAITERLLEIIIHSDEINHSHLETLEKGANLLQMKADYVANGGKFTEAVEKPSVFENREFRESVEGSFNALVAMKDLIARNLALEAGSYPRPNPEVVYSEEFTIPASKRLVAVAAKLAKKQEIVENGVVVRRKTLDLKAAMSEILERLRSGIQVLFSILLGKQTSKFDVITKLLALLELVKRRKVTVFQSEAFGPILIEKL